MVTLWNKEILCDVSFEFEGNKELVKAHKCILAASSEYFQNMFNPNSGFKEATSNAPILMKEIEPDIFREMLYFCYTSEFSPKFTKHCELALAAQKSFVPILLQLCMDHLMTGITIENVCQRLYTADLIELLNNSAFKMKCLQFFVENKEAASNTNGFKFYIDNNATLLKELLLKK